MKRKRKRDSSSSTKVLELRNQTLVMTEDYETIFKVKKFLSLDKVRSDSRIKGFKTIIVTRLKTVSTQIEIKEEEVKDGTG